MIATKKVEKVKEFTQKLAPWWFNISLMASRQSYPENVFNLFSI